MEITVNINNREAFLISAALKAKVRNQEKHLKAKLSQENREKCYKAYQETLLLFEKLVFPFNDKEQNKS